MNKKIDFMIIELGELLENTDSDFKREGLTQKYKEISLMISPYNSLITSMIDDLVLAKEQSEADKIKTLEGILLNIESI